MPIQPACDPADAVLCDVPTSRVSLPTVYWARLSVKSQAGALPAKMADFLSPQQIATLIRAA